jgi:hypothetical protein
MADSPTTPASTPPAEPDGVIRTMANRGPPASVPRWVMVFVIVFVVLVLLFVALHLTGNGFGGHMHMSAIEQEVGQQ